MIIKMGFADLEHVMSKITPVISDKLVAEDLKNLIIVTAGGGLSFSAYNGDVTVRVTAQTAVKEVEEGEVTEDYVQLSARDINNVLATFRGLKRTVVESVEFHMKKDEVQLWINERAADVTSEGSAAYNQTSRFRIMKLPAKKTTMREIEGIKEDKEFVSVPTAKVVEYIDALLPTVQKETREPGNSIVFSPDYIYTFLSLYAVSMKNALPPEMAGFRLSNRNSAFLRSLVSGTETFEFYKETTGPGAMLLTLRSGDAVAMIRCGDLSRAYAITDRLELPQNGVVVDRAYLLDVLKRVALGNDVVLVSVVINGAESSLRVKSLTMKQDIPIVTTKGSGTYNFSIRPDLLSNLVFSHHSVAENIFIYMESPSGSDTVLACKDNAAFWQTKSSALSGGNANFKW